MSKKELMVEEMTEEMVEDGLESEGLIVEKKTPMLSDLPGVGPATMEKLAAAGFSDLVSVAVASIGKITEATGMTDVSARKLVQSARASVDMGFASGDELLKRREKILKIKIPSEEINRLLDGGFETGCIVEVFGQYGSSKTQIAHQLAVSVQKQFPGSEAVYIDTENTFRPERIKQMSEGLGMDSTEVLRNIKVARAYNSDHQMLLAEMIEDLIKKGTNVRLV